MCSRRVSSSCSTSELTSSNKHKELFI
jgi:hypothetical protein